MHVIQLYLMMVTSENGTYRINYSIARILKFLFIYFAETMSFFCLVRFGRGKKKE